jgi:3-hydroxybutyryl-CoA dehydrogenase
MKSIDRIAIIGAGTMGHGIGQAFASSGLPTVLNDVNDERLDHARRMIESNLRMLFEEGEMESGEAEKILSNIRLTTNLKEAVSDADMVVEAVFEDPDVKREVFTKLDPLCSKDAIFASNTSGLNIFEIAPGIRPDRILITHWFTPPHIIPLVEVVKGPKTLDTVVTSVVELLKSVGKLPVVIPRYIPNFIVNSVQNAIGATCLNLMLQGIEPRDIDTALRASLGIRMPILGQMQSLDFNGLDLIYTIAKGAGLSMPQLEELVLNGCLGVKTSKGFYDYGGRKEEEITRDRDRKFLKIIKNLEELDYLKGV